jgi:prepilin-type N-terminal cleavage/methylation domain-containing protein
MKKAFTLIELVLSIVILSVMMLFLYKSYAGLNKSNKLFATEIEKISKIERVKKVIYLDITQSMSLRVQNQSNTEDVVFMQTSHSVHGRFQPFVAYIVKEKKLYRLESLREFTEYPLAVDSEFVVDELGEVEIFRLYTSRELAQGLYLAHALFESKDEVLLKVKALNIK